MLMETIIAFDGFDLTHDRLWVIATLSFLYTIASGERFRAIMTRLNHDISYHQQRNKVRLQACLSSSEHHIMSRQW